MNYHTELLNIAAEAEVRELKALLKDKDAEIEYWMKHYYNAIAASEANHNAKIKWYTEAMDAQGTIHQILEAFREYADRMNRYVVQERVDKASVVGQIRSTIARFENE